MKWIIKNIILLLFIISIMIVAKPAIADSTNDEKNVNKDWYYKTLSSRGGGLYFFPSR